jgi:hypothetical protein
LNSQDGRIKANAAVISVGDGSAISVYPTDTTDVILDINGYFTAPSDSTMAYYPLSPCRVADTRGPVGPLGGPFLQRNRQRDFPVLDATTCNIPSNATAYSLNMTAIPRNTLSYLTVWPSGQDQPIVSTLNAPTGTIVANAALVPSGVGGDINVYATDDTDLVIDIDGYFGPPSANLNPLSLYVLAPCRVLDSRRTGGDFNGILPGGIQVAGGACGVPDAADAYVFNATVVPRGPLGYLTLWPFDGIQPLASTLNAADGAITSNMAVVPNIYGSGKTNAYAAGDTYLIMDILSYFAP